jgi:Zn finger protein HypA/HybF involved in hydrogenase expression
MSEYIEICQSDLVHLPMDGLKKYYYAYPNKNDTRSYNIICEDCLDLFISSIANNVTKVVLNHYNRDIDDEAFDLDIKLSYLDKLSLDDIYYKFGFNTEYILESTIEYSNGKTSSNVSSSGSSSSGNTTIDTSQEIDTNVEDFSDFDMEFDGEPKDDIVEVNSDDGIATLALDDDFESNYDDYVEENEDGDIIFSYVESTVFGDASETVDSDGNVVYDFTEDVPLVGEDDNNGDIDGDTDIDLDISISSNAIKKYTLILKFKDKYENLSTLAFAFNTELYNKYSNFSLYIKRMLKSLILNLSNFELIPEDDVLALMEEMIAGRIVVEDKITTITQKGQFRCSGCNKIIDSTEIYFIRNNRKYCIDCTYAMAISEALKHVDGLDIIGIGNDDVQSSVYSINNTNSYKRKIIDRANNAYNMGITTVKR